MARRRRRTVHGESVEVLLDVLNALDPGGTDDTVEAAAVPSPLSPAQHEALVRALMRSEASLLRKGRRQVPGTRPVGRRAPLGRADPLGCGRVRHCAAARSCRQQDGHRCGVTPVPARRPHRALRRALIQNRCVCSGSKVRCREARSRVLATRSWCLRNARSRTTTPSSTPACCSTRSAKHSTQKTSPACPSPSGEGSTCWCHALFRHRPAGADVNTARAASRAARSADPAPSRTRTSP